MNLPLLPALPHLDALLLQIPPLTWAVLGLLGLLALYLLILALTKLVQFARRGAGRSRGADAAMALWLEGDGAGAMAAAAPRSDVRLRVFHALLTGLSLRPGDAEHAQTRAGQAALEELATLSRHQRGIEAAGRIAPLLGLLGTLLALIDGFARIAAAAPEAAAAGPALPAVFATALLGAAAGLAVALLAQLLGLWLEARVARERAALERLIFLALNGPAAAEG
jgi:biopolymer transport protein ExbB